MFLLLNRNRTGWRVLLAAQILFSTTVIADGLPPLARSVSSSRQFIIYGTDASLRGALCHVAERAKSALLAVLQKSDDWKTPIVVNAHFSQANLPEAPAASFNLSQTGFGLKFQLNLTIAADLNGYAIERDFLRVLLLEMMYRDQPNLDAGTAYAQPPPWLLDGILVGTAESELPKVAESLKRLLATHKTISLEEFLRQRPELLDSPSREIYRAYCVALIELLTAPPNGVRQLAKFIADLPKAPSDPVTDLRAHFAVFGRSRESADTVWRSSVAQFVSGQGIQSLSAAESGHQLDDLLHLRFPNAPSRRYWNLEDYESFRHLPNRPFVLKQLAENLMRLGTRAHPLYRPVIYEYQRIATSLARGRTRGISRRLTRLRDARQMLTARLSKIDDYMNWFEATQARTRSGKFTEYLKTADQSAGKKTRRHDPISVYLDALESQFED